MDIGLAEAAGMSLAFLAIDVGVRALRITLILRALGARLSAGAALASTLFADAAAVVTPLRAGGIPARILTLQAAGLPVPVAARAVAMDVGTYAAVVGLACASVGTFVIWGVALPNISRTDAGEVSLPLWTALVLWLLIALLRGDRAPWRSSGAGLSPSGAWQAPIATLPLVVVSIGCRIAVLPAFLLVGGTPGEPGDLVLGSLVLTYGQNYIPMPAGAGVLEVALRAGLMGGPAEFDAAYVVWRLLTVGVVAFLGFGLAVRVFGRARLAALLRQRSGHDMPS